MSDEDRAREEDASGALCTQLKAEFIGSGVAFLGEADVVTQPL
ncbi:hypothetical protein ACWCQQ_30520 [Streptomyces sp. NPDC002143]